MKNNIPGVLFLFVLLNSALALAQKPSQWHRWEARIRVDEQVERKYNISDEQNITLNTLHYQMPFTKKLTTLNVILPDFQVNENAGPNGADQFFPSISSDRNGNVVITWIDGRNGRNMDIYAQRYSIDGTMLGSNFKVNDDVGIAYPLSAPSISSAGNGNFVITWVDERGGDYDIYAQRYASDGTALGSNFIVNDNQGSADQYEPSISTDESGNFVITWSDERNVDYDIYAQRYSSDGTALGSNFKVNDDEGRAVQNNPSISSDRNGNFVIVWTDHRNGNFDIYTQRYFSDGTALGNNFKVNDDEGREVQNNSSISTDRDGNFVIIWIDERNNYSDIYAQRYLKDGTALGSNFQVNDIEGVVYQYCSPSISIDGNGNFVVTWVDERDGDSDIYAQRYSSDGTTLGSNFQVNDIEGIVFPYCFSSISADGIGNFVTTWVDVRSGDYDIFAQRYSSDGTAIANNFKVNSDEGSADQIYPSISTDGNGNFVITWKDYRNGVIDLYAQRYLNNGTALGNNFKVNDAKGSTFQFAPSISTAEDGNFVITWEDSSNHDFDIFAQRYSSDGTALGSNFKVNDDEVSAGQFDPSISIDASGNFVLTWIDGRNGHNKDIYAQRYSSDGTALGSNFKVNDDEGNPAQFDPSISADTSGNFVITWRDHRDGKADIYGQRYSNDGTVLASNFKVNDDEASAHQYSPSLSIDEGGDFVITWEDYRNGDADIYAQRYSSDGTALGANFKVNDDEAGAHQFDPSISTAENGNFVITWQDYRNGNADIYAQRFFSDGTELGSNYRVTNTNEKHQSSPDVNLWNNRIYTTWTDNRAGGTGYDIWANVLDWENPTAIGNNERYQITSTFIYSQNYPNPFNLSTNIFYSLPISSFVTLKVYDMLGSEIQTLVSEFQKSYNYSVNFDSRGLTSGIYFYRLQVGNDFIETKKMLLMK